MAGVAIGSIKDIKAIRSTLKAFGGCVNAIDAYLLDRSLKTLKVRVKGQNTNALKLAEFFESEAKIKKVHYPGLKSSPSHETAKSQMRGYGAIIAIELENLNTAKILCDNLNVALNATSLGNVETLVSIPVLTSHIKLSETELRDAGVSPGMVRVSVGLEDIDDLIMDFKQAFVKI
jgi:cystathionine beta-lyase/cystathionine gamma-synthase